MGANAQTTVPTFTAGQILTAAQQNDSARTGVPVFASTVTRDAGFGGSGEKTLAEGQLCYVEGTGLQTYNGTAWVTWGAYGAGGVLTKSQTIGSTVSSVAVTNAFITDYNVYQIAIVGTGVASAAAADLRLHLGAATSAYYGAQFGGTFAAGTYAGRGVNNQASWLYAGFGATDRLSFNAFLVNPNVAAPTNILAFGYNQPSQAFSAFSGSHETATAYTDFTITPSTGTISGGTIVVYGYRTTV